MKYVLVATASTIMTAFFVVLLWSIHTDPSAIGALALAGWSGGFAAGLLVIASEDTSEK